MKYHLFDYPHRTIRNLMFRISRELCTCTRFSEFQQMMSRVNDLQFLLNNHLFTENQIIVPYLSAELIEESDAEHHNLEEEEQRMFNFLYGIDEAKFEQEHATIELMFNRFVGNYLLHMHTEETLFQDYIWMKYSEEQQALIVMEIVRKFSPGENWMWMKYGLPFVPQEVRRERIQRGIGGLSSKQIYDLMAALNESLSADHYQELYQMILSVKA